jgi:hypothetical protein
MSSLAWIDFDESERERTDRLLAFFKEKETRDELGIGGIRDSIADLLFPGTSTIQTRVRYMLFVPWLFQKIRVGTATRNQLVAKSRDIEYRLSQALIAGGETTGVIGRDAGIDLQRPPSSIYWAGLGAWGIRKFEGSVDGYFAALRARGSASGLDEGEEGFASGASPVFWHPSLPKAPDDLHESINFKLSAEESQFLIERLMESQTTALLTFLARRRIRAECDFIWQHPNLVEFDAATRRLVEHARMFSTVFHGAALLYNLQLSELTGQDEWIQDYRNAIVDWRNGLAMSEVAAWSLDEFFCVTDHPAHRPQPRAMRFVHDWVKATVGCRAVIESSKEAKKIVRERERTLKIALSRFDNRTALERWSGASGTRQFEFRWGGAKTHIEDMIDAA